MNVLSVDTMLLFIEFCLVSHWTMKSAEDSPFSSLTVGVEYRHNDNHQQTQWRQRAPFTDMD